MLVTQETPTAPSDAVRARMRAQRTKGTGPEVAVRRAMHALGLRFRLGRRVAGCRPDVVLPGVRVAVFVDGCWWHGCPTHYRTPGSNGAWWDAKVARNSERDRRQEAALAAAGWAVLRAWEHENPTDVARRVALLVRIRRWRLARGLPLVAGPVPGPRRAVGT